jgi:hypothetical protein
MGDSMLHAILICSDESCAGEFEAWGEPDDFDALLCDACGCSLQVLAFSEVALPAVTHMLGPAAHLRLRPAA